MHMSSTECANPFLSDLTQKILGVETILLCIISLFLQLLMLKVSCKFCGWKSDFSYVLLCMMSVVGMVFYVIELIGHIRFIMLASPSDIDRFIGANFLATIFTDSMIGVLLMAHRFIYTIIPFKAARILNPTFLKMDMALVVCFFISLLCFLCTPMAGVMFCSQSMARHIMELPLKFLIDWMNTISNYMVGVCTVITYTLLAGVLIARGNIRLRNNAELRMMIQIAMMSTIGVFYFLYWEFHRFLNLDPVIDAIIYENFTLFFYDAVALPYLLLNSTFRKQFLAIFQKNGTICSTEAVIRKNIFVLSVTRAE